MKFETWYNKNHKKILILPAIVLVLALLYLIVFYVQTGDIIRKDVSLSGGTTISVLTQVEREIIEGALEGKITDYQTKVISDNTGTQLQITVTVTEENTLLLREILEETLGYELTEENSSQEITSTSLSEDFYRQLIVAIILAFFWMSAVVFLIFTKGAKTKTAVITANVLFGFFLGNFFLTLPSILAALIFTAFAAYVIRIYIKNSIPSFAVMIAAFANIVMTLAVVNLAGIQMSTAGIVAFLMLIGYSVDTDILLTTRLLRKKESVNKALWGAFKTGTTMTLTSIIAIATAFIAVSSFNSVLNLIFTILLIGLFFDIFNTWTTNASIIKWFVEEKE